MLKKISLALLIACFSLDLTASDLTAEKIKRKQDMHTLSSGLRLIQDGIIYGQKSILLSGIDMLKKGEETLLSAHGEDLKSYLPKDKAYAYKYAQATGKRIATYSQELKEMIDKDADYTDITNTYALILNECAGCHIRIREK